MTNYTIPMIIGTTLAFMLGAAFGALWAVRYCALVSRDRSNPRRRTALGGNGMQWLELRSNVCGTVTTVNKDTLLWVRRGETIKF